MVELDPELRALQRAGAARGLAPMVTLSPPEARERVSAGNRLCNAGPSHVAARDVDAVHRDQRVPVRVYAAEDDRGVTLVYAHGGGWVTGDLEYADEVCRHLAADAACTVVSVDYRLAPEHPHPAGLDDVETVLHWAAAQPWTRTLAAAGDSAGANLVAVVTQRLVAAGGPVPAFQVLTYPVVDTDLTTASYVDGATAFPIGVADMEWFLEHYVAATHRSDPSVSPLRSPDLARTPPTHVVTVGHDPLRSEGESWAQALRSAGVPVTHDHHPTLCHGFLRFTAASAAARAARDRLVAEVRTLAHNHAYDPPVASPGDDTVTTEHLSGEPR